MKDFSAILKDKAQVVDQTLQMIMENQQPVSEKLAAAMEYTLFSGGKRIRPVLTLLTCELVAGEMSAARRTGAALELIHTYSLIHDDLPSMDDDDYRRGNPTNHQVYGPGFAILAGDGLLTMAFEVLSELKLPAEKKIKIISTISKGAGPQGMVGGQALDLDGEKQELDFSDLVKIHENKTGALISASILAGAYCGSPETREIKSLKKYASNLGLLFQVTDDILDVTGDKEALGKSTGQDQKLNKATYPSLLGLEESRKQAQTYAAQAREALNTWGSENTKLKQLVDFVLHREK
ncbi:MAG: polyprenyl synthetase family protein [Bacillota bacterium]